MPGKRPDVHERLEQYHRCCAEGDGPATREATRRALADKHCLLVSRAAELCAERLFYDLEPDLIAAYGRFLSKPGKSDPHCTAKGAIARALVALDRQDADFYIAGLSYRQPEPVWGGTTDTAVDLRTTCAMGLVATPYPRALIELVGLLADPEPRARIGAVRAIACSDPLAAEALLRSKALAGDDDPEVIGECLAELLRLEPEESPGFVADFLDDQEPVVRELAALALGESRSDDALQILRERWDQEPLKGAAERTLLRAAVLHRSEAAFDWLLDIVAEGDRESAGLVIAGLAVYRASDRLRERLLDAVIRRGDDGLKERFADAWGEHGEPSEASTPRSS